MIIDDLEHEHAMRVIIGVLRGRTVPITPLVDDTPWIEVRWARPEYL